MAETAGLTHSLLKELPASKGSVKRENQQYFPTFTPRVPMSHRTAYKTPGLRPLQTTITLCFLPDHMSGVGGSNKDHRSTAHDSLTTDSSFPFPIHLDFYPISLSLSLSLSLLESCCSYCQNFLFSRAHTQNRSTRKEPFYDPRPVQ